MIISILPALLSFQLIYYHRSLLKTAPGTVKYNFMNRQENLRRLQNESDFDICIIGGGATGAGIALDATLRGLKVILIEKHDFAAQTSSKATKLIHGGVRYLEQAVKTLDWEQFRMVRKALRERTILLKNAPHLSRPLALLTPCFSWIESIYYAIGLKMYDWIAGSHNVGSSKRLSKKKALELIPELKGGHLNSAVLYYDGQLDDARYCLSIVQTAAEKGAVVLNHTQAISMVKSEKSLRIKSLVIKDLLGSKEYKINAKVFVNATGPFADHIRQMANPKLKPRMRVSRGAHIVLPPDILKGDTAILVPKTDDGRVVFIIPWQDHTLVGTTDEEDVLSETPVLEDYEARYLLEYVNRFLETPVNHSQISSGFAGLRPLLQAALQSTMETETKSLVRDHEVEIDNRSKLVSIMGGKWTTYRLMAKDTVDQIFHEVLAKKAVPCTTEHQLLHGAEGYNFDDWKRLADEYGISELSAKHLMKKYGSNAAEVLKLTKNRKELLTLIVEGHPFIKAEVLYNIQNEMACTVDDILDRRLGLRLRDAKAAKEAETFITETLNHFTEQK